MGWFFFLQGWIRTAPLTKYTKYSLRNLHLVWFLNALVVVFIMARTKREFAAKLLFWLLPWPISKALPRSLMIYYFGPAGGPPPGFYDYWGTPGEFWPDMYTPPDPENFPEPPAGPSNPSDPYTPGPGPVNPHPSVPSDNPPPGWQQCLDDSFWETKLKATWNVDHWDFIGVNEEVSIKVKGTWHIGYIPTKFRLTHDYGAHCYMAFYNKSDVLLWEGFCNSTQIYNLMLPAGGTRELSWLMHSSPPGGSNFDLTNIEFYS